MEFDIKKNSAAEVSEKCTEDNTAIKLGSGKSPVYATPALVALMENAAINACDPQLPEGYNTVGIAMNVKHVAATPIGLTITANRGQILNGIFLQKLYDVIHHKYLLIGIWVLGIAIFILRNYNNSVSIYCKVSTLLCYSY